MAFSKWEDVREVTFKESYFIGVKQIYAKGSTHYMRKEIAEKLQAEGVNMTVKEYDVKKGIAAAKKRAGVK